MTDHDTEIGAAENGVEELVEERLEVLHLLIAWMPYAKLMICVMGLVQARNRN